MGKVTWTWGGCGYMGMRWIELRTELCSSITAPGVLTVGVCVCVFFFLNNFWCVCEMNGDDTHIPLLLLPSLNVTLGQ